MPFFPSFHARTAAVAFGFSSRKVINGINDGFKAVVGPMESCQMIFIDEESVAILVLSSGGFPWCQLFCPKVDRCLNASSVFHYLVAAGKASHAAWSFQQQLVVGSLACGWACRFIHMGLNCFWAGWFVYELRCLKSGSIEGLGGWQFGVL